MAGIMKELNCMLGIDTKLSTAYYEPAQSKDCTIREMGRMGTLL